MSRDANLAARAGENRHRGGAGIVATIAADFSITLWSLGVPASNGTHHITTIAISTNADGDLQQRSVGGCCQGELVVLLSSV